MLKSTLEEWKSHRQLTLDLLDSLPENKLSFSVSKKMGPLGKQFRHIGDVQLCYVKAIKTKKIDFGKYRKDYSIENSKEKLKSFLKEMDNEMFSLLKKLDSKQVKEFKIDWGFDKLSLKDHFTYLIQHEIFHHGQLVVYIRDLGLKFPKSWSVWGL